jgi:serine/threonine protein kinase
MLGTLAFMAPEIHYNKPYQGHVVDLFSIGVILFMMYSGVQPFKFALPTDEYY